MPHCPFCQTWVAPSVLRCRQCHEILHINVVVPVANFTVPVSLRFSKAFGVKTVFNHEFKFLNFPLNVFLRAYSSAGVPGEGWDENPVPAGVRKGVNLFRSRVIADVTGIRSTFPNAGFRVLPAGDVSFFFPPMVLKHYQNTNQFTTNFVVAYNIGFVNSSGYLNLPDPFYEADTAAFWQDAIAILDWVVQFQPQNRVIIRQQQVEFVRHLRRLRTGPSPFFSPHVLQTLTSPFCRTMTTACTGPRGTSS